MSVRPLAAEFADVADELLVGLDEAAAHYEALAERSARSAGSAPSTARRVAAAATLIEGALLAHGRAPSLTSEEILVADLRLALAAEETAGTGDAEVELAMAEAVMTLARGIAANTDGLGISPREVLGPVVSGAAVATRAAER